MTHILKQGNDLLLHDVVEEPVQGDGGDGEGGDEDRDRGEHGHHLAEDRFWCPGPVPTRNDKI